MSPFERKKQPRQARSRETVDAILKSVVLLVDQKNPDELTTTKIAERAGISIGSLYQYFPGKESIFAALLEWYLKKEVELILAMLAAQANRPIEKAVDEMLDAIIAIRRKNLKLEQALLGFFARTGDLEFLKTSDEQMVLNIDKALTDAAARGYVKKNATTAFLLLHLIRSTFLAATIERPALYEQPVELRQNLARVVLACLQAIE